MTKTGAGTLALNGFNTFTGNVSLNAGTLRIVDDANRGDAFNGVTLTNGLASLPGLQRFRRRW